MYKRQHPITILLGIRIATLLPFISRIVAMSFCEPRSCCVHLSS
ncbi:hypothetical protein PTB13_21750 [Bacillus sp. MHSD17]|nr:hypothetical protein [Bacillus sp. MHSD17]